MDWSAIPSDKGNTSEMKHCGCKEKCFEKGECWGHLEGVLCKHLQEKDLPGRKCASICGKDSQLVAVYTTKRERDALLKADQSQTD